MAVGINEGTQTFLKSTTSGTTEVSHVQVEGGTLGAVTVADIPGGTIDLLSAITTLPDLPGGTVDSVTAVTSVSNLVTGTLASVPAVGARHADAWATVVSTGTSTKGTLKAAVSGSSIYITDLVVSAGTATNVEIASGGTSTPILGTLHLADNGGAVMNFVTPIYTASGSALVYKQSTDGPLTITAGGYVD